MNAATRVVLQPTGDAYARVAYLLLLQTRNRRSKLCRAMPRASVRPVRLPGRLLPRSLPLLDYTESYNVLQRACSMVSVIWRRDRGNDASL